MSLGITEIILILVVILILFGGKRIPELAKALGKASYEYKKAKETLQNEAEDFQNAVNAAVEKEVQKEKEKSSVQKKSVAAKSSAGKKAGTKKKAARPAKS